MQNNRIQKKYGFLLAVLAVVFTIGLTFASVEFPRLMDSLRIKAAFLQQVQ